MISPPARKDAHMAPGSIAGVDASYGPAVERYLGRPKSAERLMRLESIRARLRAEGSPVAIKQPGQPPLMAYLTKDAHSDSEMLHIVDLNEPPAPTTTILETVFGLSAAEARLAQLVATGESLESVAGLLGVKITTARSQLAAIFEKTGTRRQAKLVALLSRLAHTR